MNRRRTSAGDRLVAAATAAAAAGIAWWVTSRTAPSGWRRTNYAGRTVVLASGPALVAGVLGGIRGRSGWRLPVLICLTGTVGAVDDLRGGAHARGLSGHLQALREGTITTGAVKLVAVSGAGLLCAPSGRATRRVRDAALIAGMANLANLFDLRPGRTLKVVAGLTLPMLATRVSRPAAALLGASAAVALPDLWEHSMLGDSGANAAGAAVGWLWAAGAPEPARDLLLALVVGLTLLSERVSFTAVIENRPALARLDRLGRIR